MDNNTYFIEKSILASVLNFEKNIADFEITPDFFEDNFHKKLIIGCFRLKELNEPIDFELLRNKFLKANKWTIQEDAKLIDIMTNTIPFGSDELFSAYLKVLKNNYYDKLARGLVN